MATIEGKRLVTVTTTKALEAVGAYSAETVLSNSDTPGAGVDWDFSDVGKVNGGTGYITKAQAISETTAVTPRLTLFLFNAAPTCELDDQAANTALLHADLANYVGKIDFPAMEDLGTGDSEALATPSTPGNLPLAFNCASADKALYGVLVTRTAVTFGAGDDMTLILTCEQY